MTRRDLAIWFAEMGFTRGAEIGVERGKFSETLCQSIPGLRLLAIDAWTTKPGYREHVSQVSLDGFERSARERLAPYQATVVKGFSVDVAQLIPDASLDFAYIDADHSDAEVKADIAAWLPKVRRGGCMAGHDWNLPGVEKAVVASAEGRIGLTNERSPSWWWTRA